MALPKPRGGLVIGYSYIWKDEALSGAEEGRKDRPCVVVLAVEAVDGTTVVTVAPITHSPPSKPEHAVELSPSTKQRLGLDDHRSWVVTNDLNRFEWPGFDLRPTQRGSERFDYGELPADVTRKIKASVLALARTRQISINSR